MESEAELPPRETTPGRGQGSGVWLEERTRDAYERWGYEAARGGRIWGFEIDVFAVDGEVRRVIQCKDWRDCAKVTPADMWRLVAIAMTISARPVLVTTTQLTDGARKIADLWEVPVLTPADLEGDEVIYPTRMVDTSGERRWESRFADDDKMEELLFRAVTPIYEQTPRY